MSGRAAAASGSSTAVAAPARGVLPRHDPRPGGAPVHAFPEFPNASLKCVRAGARSPRPGSLVPRQSGFSRRLTCWSWACGRGEAIQVQPVGHWGLHAIKGFDDIGLIRKPCNHTVYSSTAFLGIGFGFHHRPGPIQVGFLVGHSRARHRLCRAWIHAVRATQLFDHNFKTWARPNFSRRCPISRAWMTEFQPPGWVPTNAVQERGELLRSYQA